MTFKMTQEVKRDNVVTVATLEETVDGKFHVTVSSFGTLHEMKNLTAIEFSLLKNIIIDSADPGYKRMTPLPRN